MIMLTRSEQLGTTDDWQMEIFATDSPTGARNTPTQKLQSKQRDQTVVQTWTPVGSTGAGYRSGWVRVFSSVLTKKIRQVSVSEQSSCPRISAATDFQTSSSPSLLISVEIYEHDA